jgi:hypothetical protein
MFFSPSALLYKNGPYFFLTRPSRGDSPWPAFAGTWTGQGLLCRRRSHPRYPRRCPVKYKPPPVLPNLYPTRDPGLSTALLSRSTLEHAITHSATPHLRPTHTRSLSNSSALLSTRPCRAPVPPTLAPFRAFKSAKSNVRWRVRIAMQLLELIDYLWA